MEYQVLARRWRPQTFDKIVGQPAVVKTLMNAISSNRLAHAYLFSGPRGIGKTSIARIFAKAINCEKGPAAEPCNQCGNCREISAGISPDVIEIDAASNRGIDDIRALREHVKYIPSTSKFKIYIIDEVHMVTKEAFNALLKTLEEPPEHVKFFFATTEPHKIPETILSRCQRFDLKRISTADIKKRLQEIAQSEKVKIDDDVFYVIARAADGSMRDAESIFDQVISCCGNKVTGADVEEILGLVSEDIFFAIDEAVLNSDIGTAVELTNKIISAGKNTTRFIDDMIKHYRDLLVVKAARDTNSLLEVSAETFERLKQTEEKYSEENLLHIIELLAQAQDNMRFAISKETLLEVTIIKLVRARSRIDLNEIIAKLESLRGGEQEQSGAILSRSGGSILHESKPQLDLLADSDKPEKTPQPQAIPEEIRNEDDPHIDAAPDQKAESLWKKVVESIGHKKPRIAESLAAAVLLGLSDGVLRIGYPGDDHFHRESVDKKKNRELIERELLEQSGIKIRVELASSGKTSADNKSRPGLDEHPIVQKALEKFNGKIIKERR